MCGIVGIIKLNGKKIQGTKEICNMMQLQKHRGPDDAGIFAFNFDCLENSNMLYANELRNDFNYDAEIGFNRLSIRDLSMNGHQPMAAFDKKVIITFNGEIYNTKEYRVVLEQKGYTFRGNTDTEVILNLYLEYGVGAIKKLNGMFAICIVDLRKRKVILTRDRLGIKPLYYYNQNEIFMYASEMKSFLAVEAFKPGLNLSAVNEYFTFRSARCVCLLKDVKQIFPGEILELDFCGKQRKALYWTINEYHRANNLKSSKKILSELEFLLEDAVKKQMVSDVNIASQLSGGIDSSLVTYYSRKNKLSETVSIIFEDETYSEKKYIEYVGSMLDMKNQEFVLSSNWAVENLENTIWHLESMLTHSNAIGLNLLTANARKYATVLLSGEGADELFGGYSEFLTGYFVSEYLNKSFLQFKKVNEKLFKGGEYSFANFIVMAQALPSIYPQKVLNIFNNEEIIQHRIQEVKGYTGSDFDKQIKYELNYYLPDLLLRQDKMSMANSIENRVPFLDNRIVDFAFSIPQKMLLKKDFFSIIKDGNFQKVISGKDVLKRLCAEKFGKNFAYRNKVGFSIPVKEYLSNVRMNQFYNEELKNSMKNRNIFNIKQIERQMNNIQNLSSLEIECLWRCITLEIWARLFIDKKYNL